MQERRRLIDVEIQPGKSQTRLHIAMDNPMLPDQTTELHIAHHADGDLKEPAQWYNIYEHPTVHQLELARQALGMNEEDWKILEHILGSFRWAIVKHTDPTEIRVDEAAIRSDGDDWETAYF